MRKSETRLHIQEEDDPAAAPCFHQQSQALRVLMTSAGMWKRGAHFWLVVAAERGGAEEVRIVEWTNDLRDDSFLGYKFCQPIQSTDEYHKVS